VETLDFAAQNSSSQKAYLGLIEADEVGRPIHSY
jgi:hypothetical protein